MPRVTIKRLMIGIALVGVPLAWACLEFRRSRIIEELNDPHQIVGWSSATLILDDGRRIPLPGISQLPPVSKLLSAAVARGVEVAPDGRVTGLLRCRSNRMGHTRVKQHIKRVDIASLLIFLKEVDFPIDPEIDQGDWEARRTALERWDSYHFEELRLFREELDRKNRGS